MRDYPKISQPIVQRALTAVGAVFAKHTLKNNPVPWKTGNLLHSFRFKESPLAARWFPTANYAGAVEFGTRPRTIVAKGKALRIPIGGGFIFRKSVNHPGTKPRRYMQQIVDRSKPDVEKLFGQANDAINREIAKQVAQG